MQVSRVSRVSRAGGQAGNRQDTRSSVQVQVMRLPENTAGSAAGGAGAAQTLGDTRTPPEPPPLITFQLLNAQNKFCSSNSKWALDNPGESSLCM